MKVELVSAEPSIDKTNPRRRYSTVAGVGKQPWAGITPLLPHTKSAWGIQLNAGEENS